MNAPNVKSRKRCRLSGEWGVGGRQVLVWRSVRRAPPGIVLFASIVHILYQRAPRRAYADTWRALLVPASSRAVHRKRQNA